MHDTFSNAPVFPEPAFLPGQDQERADQLPAGNAFALSPFYYSTVNQRLPGLETPSPLADPLTLKQLSRLRKSPGFALIGDSPLLLQAVQLDLDYPVPWPVYARERLIGHLQVMAGQPLDPDHLRLRLSHAQGWVDEHGDEHHLLDCSLTELAVASADLQQLAALARTTPVDDRPLPGLEHMSASDVLRRVIDQRWFDDYLQGLNTFWQRHANTWLSLARLAFIDELAHQRKRGTLSQAGYYLTLDALGYASFPTDSQTLAAGRIGGKAEVRLLYIDDEPVPGLFQVRSRLNAHCFIHRPGAAQAPIEYISDDPEVMTARLLGALNTSNWHRQWLEQQPVAHDKPPRLESRPLQGDVFRTLLQVARECAEDSPSPHNDDLLHRFIARSMSLACAVDLWQAQPAILDALPRPDQVANELMKSWLHEHHGLDLDPRQVFIAYRPGEFRTLLGHVSQANTWFHVPDETPLNLAKALIGHYQIESPSGYIDHGAQTVVYHDPGGKGEWARDRVLPIEAAAVCAYIEQTDFLAVMTRRIVAFWDGQQDSIERALCALLVTQAVISLKTGALQRSGFAAIVASFHSTAPCWKALGFDVQSDPLEGLSRQPCASLLVLCPDNTSRRVLYQAGQHKAFIEFADATALSAYLGKASADERWRHAVLHYVPARHRERLAYLFKYWSGLEQASPASLLRPWTDLIYNPDVHRTLADALHEHALPAGPPMPFMRQTLKANALEDARQLIVTSRQASLQYWRARLQHLQWLLAPMSLLLTPAMLASLATQAGLVGVDIAQANLPGQRQAEKRQALLSTLTLGLLGLAPLTPRLYGALNRLGTVGKAGVHAAKAPVRSLHTFGTWLGRSPGRRQTRLEKFFHTDSLLKRWTIAPHPHFGGMAVHAWKVGRKFLLWTCDRGQARTLVVSTHGYHLPWSKTVAIPNGTHIHTYAPHGYVLIDPALHRVVNQRASPFGISSAAGNTAVPPGASLPPLTLTDKLMAGTVQTGRLKNYTLSKYQGQGGESYQEITQVVRNSNARPFGDQRPPAPMDVLTVRNRFGRLPPTLEDLFDTLAAQGIHYDRILLLHCRCAALAGLLRRAPVWSAPGLSQDVPITP